MSPGQNQDRANWRVRGEKRQRADCNTTQKQRHGVDKKLRQASKREALLRLHQREGWRGQQKPGSSTSNGAEHRATDQSEDPSLAQNHSMNHAVETQLDSPVLHEQQSRDVSGIQGEHQAPLPDASVHMGVASASNHQQTAIEGEAEPAASGALGDAGPIGIDPRGPNDGRIDVIDRHVVSGTLSNEHHVTLDGPAGAPGSAAAWPLQVPLRQFRFWSKASRLTSQLRVEALGGTVQVTVTNEAAVVDRWIAQHAREDLPVASGTGHALESGGGVSVLGLDVEWRPSFTKNVQNPAGLVQISTSQHCLLVQLLFLDRTPENLVSLFQAPDVQFVGVGVKEDARKLAKDHGFVFQPGGVVEVASLVRVAPGVGGARTAGLKDYCFFALGETLVKDKRVTMSNWSAYRLNDVQVRYAAVDAWVSYRIAMQLILSNSEEDVVLLH